MNPALALQASTLADPNAMPGAQMPGQPPAQPSAVVPQDVALKLAAGTTDTSKGPTTTQVVPTPEINQNVAAIAQSGVDEVAAQEKLKATAVANEQLEAKSAADRAALAAQTEKDREEARQWKEVELPKRMAAWDAAQAEAEKKSTMTTLWQDMSTPRKLLTAIGVGLGAAASSYNHGPNQAYEIYRDAENAHRQAAESELQNAVRKAQAKGASVEQVTKLFTSKIEDLDHREITKDALLIKQLEALKKTNPTAAANADVTISKIKEDKAKKELDARMALAQHRTDEGSIHTVTSSESTPTAPAGGGKSEGLAINAASARRQMDEINKLPLPTPEEVSIASTAERSYERQQAQELEVKGGGVSQMINELGREHAPGLFPKTPLGDISETSKQVLGTERAIAAQVLLPKFGPRSQANEKAWERGTRELTGQSGDSVEEMQRKRKNLDAEVAIMERAASGTPAAAKQGLGTVGSPVHPRGIAPAKQDAAAGAASDWEAVGAAIRGGKVKLSGTELKDMQEAYSAQKAASLRGSVDPEAAQFFRLLRIRKGI